jgi:hypothetical protein
VRLPPIPIWIFATLAGTKASGNDNRAAERYQIVGGRLRGLLVRSQLQKL